MATWAEHAIWWHVYPLGFLGAERNAGSGGKEPVSRLRALEPWLDYMIELGCNGLALGPIFDSETHGYDTVDHHRIDARLGSEDDLKWLLDVCGERGVKVLLDGVFNHVGRGFAPFQDVLVKGRESAYADWFRLNWDVDVPDGFAYADFEGHRQLVALNHDTTAVADYVVGVMNQWLDFGADGWRLDAAYAVPLTFWRQVSDRVRERHPQAWLVGEVLHGDYPLWVRDGGLDSTTQYELWKAIWSSLNDRNFFELSWALDRHNAFAEEFRPLTFVGNHDVTRLASRLDDPRHFGHALAVLLTVAGVPSIYAGDEQSFQGVKEEHTQGDEEIRSAFPATPDGLAPYGWPVYRLHQELIGIRRRRPWLGQARTRVLHLTNEQLAYEAVHPQRLDSMVVLLNVADRPYRFDIDLPAHDVLATSTPGGWQDSHVEAHGWVLLGR